MGIRVRLQYMELHGAINQMEQHKVSLTWMKGHLQAASVELKLGTSLMLRSFTHHGCGVLATPACGEVKHQTRDGSDECSGVGEAAEGGLATWCSTFSVGEGLAINPPATTGRGGGGPMCGNGSAAGQRFRVDVMDAPCSRKLHSLHGKWTRKPPGGVRRVWSP